MLLRPSLVIRFRVVIVFGIPVVLTHFPPFPLYLLRAFFFPILCTLAFSLAGCIRTRELHAKVFVKKSASISCAGQNATFTCPFLFGQYTRRKLLNTGQQF